MMTEEIDWAKVALDYRNTDIPLRELARRHGVSHSGILRRAKRDRWGPRQVAGTPPADVKLPAETGKLPVETGKLPVETPSRIEIWRAHRLRARECAAQYLIGQRRWSRTGAGQCHRGWSHAEMMTEEIDWAKVALDYRNTDIPLRELARRHGVSHSGILRRAKRDRWGPRQVAGTRPADVKLPAKTGKLPVETGKLPVETPSRIEIWRAHGLPRSWVRTPVFDPPVAVEPHRRRFLAVVVFMIGALAMATSGTATIWYAAHQISNLPQQLTAAGFSAVFELGNASLLAGAGALYARRHWACVPIAGLWVISFGFCIFTAAAFMASTISEGQAQRARVLSHTTAVGEELSRLRAERAVIAEIRSLEMLTQAWHCCD